MGKALKAFHQGHQRDPQNTLLLKNLTVTTPIRTS